MTDTPTPNLDEIKQTIKEFADKETEEALHKILDGKKLSDEELHEVFYSVLPWMSLSLLNKRYRRNKLHAEKEWNAVLDIKLDLNSWGTVEHLEILPLIDAKADSKSLLTEHGVSYLVKADDKTILFDVGFNKERKHPSPLLQNMEKLGVNIKDIDYVFISHPHGDHCGGGMWVRENTFGLSGVQQDLSDVTAFTATEMNHPSAKVKYIGKPMILGKGIASIGPILQPMFFAGSAIEHSLIVNLKGKGLVIIVGCGHQSVPSIIERTENIVDKKIPIYSFIGGMHLPIPKFPNAKDWMGIPYYKFTGTRRPIWEPWSELDIQDAIQSLKTRGVNLVSISSHDSSDESIEIFRTEFEQYIDLRVGKPIIL